MKSLISSFSLMLMLGCFSVAGNAATFGVDQFNHGDSSAVPMEFAVSAMPEASIDVEREQSLFYRDMPMAFDSSVLDAGFYDVEPLALVLPLYDDPMAKPLPNYQSRRQ